MLKAIWKHRNLASALPMGMALPSIFTNNEILTHPAAIGAHKAPDSLADNDELRRRPRWRPVQSELAKRGTPAACQWGLVGGERDY
jgi:hypothetical protein